MHIMGTMLTHCIQAAAAARDTMLTRPCFCSFSRSFARAMCSESLTAHADGSQHCFASHLCSQVGQSTRGTLVCILAVVSICWLGLGQRSLLMLHVPALHMTSSAQCSQGAWTRQGPVHGPFCSWLKATASSLSSPAMLSSK